MVIYVVIFRLRATVKSQQQAAFFIPAFNFKVLGAVLLGLIYQFYYGGGDTFFYYSDGRQINSKDFWTALNIIFGTEDHIQTHYPWARYLTYFGDAPSFMISRLSGLASLFSFKTYTVNSILFASFSFAGSWKLYVALTDRYPTLHRELAIATLFVPSTFLWGAGLLKDSITFGAIGFVFYYFYFGVIKRKKFFWNGVGLMVSALAVLSIKSYILYALAPALFLWTYLEYQKRLPSPLLKFLFILLQLIVIIGLTPFFIQSYGQEMNRQLDAFGAEAKETAEWIRYMSKEGSSYDIGELDGTFSGTIQYLPKAVFIAIFRPSILEATNPLMLLAALENLVIVLIVLRLLLRRGLLGIIRRFRQDNFLVFAMAFTILFGFVIGVMSSNFGTLVRYKIPMLPFFISALFVILGNRPSGRFISSSNQVKEEAPKQTRGYVRIRDR